MKNNYFPKTFLQSILLLFLGMLFGMPFLYLQRINYISADLYILFSFIGWFIGTLIIFYFKNRKVNLLNQFKFNIKKEIYLLVFLIIIFQISLYLPLSYYINSSISEATSFQSGLKYNIILLVSAAFFEEIMFRGIILKGYLSYYSNKKAILISSLFFGLIHFNLASPLQFIGAILFGFVTAYVFYYTKSIGMTILLHLTYNLNVYVMGKIHRNYGSFKINKITDLYGDYSIYVIIASFLILLCTVYHIVKNKEQIINKLKQLDASQRLPI